MLRTKLTVYTMLFGFIGQPVLYTLAQEANTPEYTKYNESELLDGKRDGKAIDLDAQLEALTNFGKAVASACTELDGKPLSVKGDGTNLQFVTSTGSKVSESDFNRIEKFSAAFTTPVGITSMTRPLNCEEALYIYKMANDNFEERRQRAVSDERQKVSAVTLADGKTKGAGCIDCGKAEAASERAPGSSGLEKTLSDVAAKAGDDSFNIDAAIAGGTTTACAASQDTKSNAVIAAQKAFTCTTDSLAKIFGMAPRDKGVNGFLSALASGPGGCVADMVGAAVKGLWSSMKALFIDLPALAYEGAKAGVKKIGTWAGLVKAEDATSDKLTEVSKTSDSQLAKFQKDPFNYIIGGLKNVVNFFLGEVTSELGCDKWAGLPYASECESPWTGWSCANCGQVQAMVCGSAGAVISTVLASGAMGAVFRGGTKLAKGIFKAVKPSEVKKLAAAVEKTKPRFSVAQNVKAKGSVVARAKSSVSTAGQRTAKAVAETKIVTKSVEKLGKKWAQYKATGVSRVLSRLGDGAKTALASSWKGVKTAGKAVGKVTDFDAWPDSMLLRVPRGAGRLTSDYFYAVNRAFEGRMINPLRVRSARLYDKAARRAVAEEAKLSTGWAATAKTVDGMIVQDVATQVEKVIQVTPGSEQAAEVLMAQAKRMGTDQFIPGVSGLEKMDELHAALKTAKTTVEKEAVYSRIGEVVESGAVQNAFPKSSARGALAKDIVADLKAGRVPNTAALESVEGLETTRTLLRAKQAKLETELANAKTGAQKAKVEQEIRSFNEAMKEDYITQSVKTAMTGDAAQASALTSKMSELGFYFDPQELERGIYKIVHPKETMEVFHQQVLSTVGDNVAVKGLNKVRASTAVAYNKNAAIIRVKNPSTATLKNTGFASKEEYFSAIEKDAKSMGLRVDKATDGVSIRPKQGSVDAYNKAEKELVAQMDQVGYKFDPKTRLAAPKPGEALEVMGMGRTGYEGANKIIVDMAKNDSELLRSVMKNADEAGMQTSKVGDDIAVDMKKMAKECNTKGGGASPLGRMPSGR